MGQPISFISTEYIYPIITITADIPKDDDLVTLLIKGDQAAFKQLVERFQNIVFNTCLNFLTNQEDAEDATQEVFIEVFNAIDQFKGQSKLSTWIYRIAVTKSLEHIRRRKSKKRWAFMQSLFGNEDQIWAPSRDANDHPGAMMENKERSKVLFSAIDQLPDNQRVAFTLHKIDGQSYQEVSQIMELSVSSVESLMFRAKKNLQKKLTGYYKKNL
ncbi:MAG: RNA polymerase sigma factor [Bacteroidota bacterium]